ncbi:transposase [Neobacillus sp. PS2-9]|uniref:transposase n=1 Tax=Neobacillus sp. PS2-9 TaxID=3070676 RepID=UPI0027E12096|nr:transposase [Neobacillus sp. PS2-9]WML57686.1 transposase [Neobacillus sp. PS2-9]
MKFILILGSVLTPLFLAFLQKVQPKLRLLFNIVAIVSSLVFGNISSIAIYEIIKDNTVFMTNIHSIFLNPLFLLTGAYLGTYIIYRILLLTLEEIE